MMVWGTPSIYECTREVGVVFRAFQTSQVYPLQDETRQTMNTGLYICVLLYERSYRTR